MNTIALYFLLGLGGLMLASVIPGLKILAEPLMKMFFEFLKFIFGNLSFWTIYAVKTIYRSHVGILYHLTHTKEQADPLYKMRASAEERTK